jgi:hypothetical protein
LLKKATAYTWDWYHHLMGDRAWLYSFWTVVYMWCIFNTVSPVLQIYLSFSLSQCQQQLLDSNPQPWEDVASALPLSNGSICLCMNYSVLNETKWNKKWLNTEDFRLVNYSFNTGNICSNIGQIVTDFFLQIFQQLNK